jgi:hypothetical protein
VCGGSGGFRGENSKDQVCEAREGNVDGSPTNCTAVADPKMAHPKKRVAIHSIMGVVVVARRPPVEEFMVYIYRCSRIITGEILDLRTGISGPRVGKIVPTTREKEAGEVYMTYWFLSAECPVRGVCPLKSLLCSKAQQIL